MGECENNHILKPEKITVPFELHRPFSRGFPDTTP